MWIATLAKHSNQIPWWFHESTPKKVIAIYSKAANDALITKGNTDGISKILGYNPYDWYGIPKIDSIEWIRKWLKRVWLKLQESDKDLGAVLQRSYHLALEYMSTKWYYFPSRLANRKTTNINEIIWFMIELNKLTKDGDIESWVILLKFIRAYYKNITQKNSRGNKIFDSLTWDIQEKDKKFIGEIMKFFNNTDLFQYNGWSIQFSRESSIAKGCSTHYGTHAEFIATFDAKTLESQVQKTVSQNAYDEAESIKDRNRMRIEVKTPAEMLQMALVIANSDLFKKDLSWEQKWTLFTEEWEVWKNFQMSYINNETIPNLTILKLLQSLPYEKIKWNTIDRQELKLVSTNPSFEVQIVLVWNTNESWWNASPFYKMKADIDEEIVVRQWYITRGRIMEHIKRRLPDLQKYGLPSGISPEKIFEQFLEIEKKILPLYQKDIKPKKDKDGNIIPPNPNHTDFFTNADFTGRAVKIRDDTNLPYVIWSRENNSFYPIN